MIQNSPQPVHSEPTFVALIRLIGLLQRAVQPLLTQFGISGAQWAVLRILSKAEDSGGTSVLRMTDLSDRLLIRPPSVSGVVDGLERMALITRDHAHADLRVKPVGLTRKGKRLVEAFLPVHENRIQEIFRGLKPTEQAEFQRLLGIFSQHLETMLENDSETI